MQRKIKVLLIGYGSIAKRHEEVLLSMEEIEKVDLVTKQTLSGKRTFKSLAKVKNIGEYDYFIIATETFKHLEQLKFLESKLSGKIILCEKPLFAEYRKVIVSNNLVFVGYVLRFHPLLLKLRELLTAERVLNTNVICGQYLPEWRPGIDYRDSYSAKRDEGGGVLLDLSHEIDYIQWLFGKMSEIKSYQMKISDLDIDSDDFVTVIGKTEKNVMVNFSIDCISKISCRKILVNTLDNTYELDFIANVFKGRNKAGVEENFRCEGFERNFMFRAMHKSILSGREFVCGYNEGLDVMKTISIIQGQN
ncbi:MAG: Gfo/Idh/MocA family oxidoreductase [Victivallaceae bacterium]|nr:Gfo/Idh/MocA family oxidoreductase [Victivallaceae bacterium]